MPHTVPNRPTIRTRRADRGQEEQARFEPLDLALDRDVEHLVDPLREARNLPARPLERALPLPHRRDEDRAEPGRVRLGLRPVEFLQRPARPERLLEGIHRLPGAGEQERLVDDDRPAPDRGGQEPEHHELDDWWALQNRPHSDMSCAICAPCAASTGFIRGPRASGPWIARPALEAAHAALPDPVVPPESVQNEGASGDANRRAPGVTITAAAGLRPG